MDSRQGLGNRPGAEVLKELWLLLADKTESQKGERDASPDVDRGSEPGHTEALGSHRSSPMVARLHLVPVSRWAPLPGQIVPGNMQGQACRRRCWGLQLAEAEVLDK